MENKTVMNDEWDLSRPLQLSKCQLNVTMATFTLPPYKISQIPLLNNYQDKTFEKMSERIIEWDPMEWKDALISPQAKYWGSTQTLLKEHFLQR